jgi:drug/metabolite transporter (DMT)-like permease
MGYLLAMLAALLWATLGILGKFLYGYNADPLTVVAIRATIAFLTLAAILAVVDRRLLHIRRQDIPFFVVYGLVGVTCNYAFYFYALKFTSVTTAVILLYTYPALVTLLAAVFLKERLDWLKGVVLILTFVGCFAVAQGYDSATLTLNLKGVLLGLGAGLTAAIYSLFGKKALQRHNSWTTVCYAFGFGALFLLFLRPPQAILSTAYPWQAWMAILALAWFPTLLAYALFMASMRYIEASKASITATLEPVVASLLAYFFLNETIEWPQLVGVGLVLAGIIALQFSPQVSPQAAKGGDEPDRLAYPGVNNS